MRVVNVHQRVLPVEPARAGALVDGVSSAQDQLWPGPRWPRMVLDRPLGVGATGGHGPIGYFVEAYEPGRMVRFRFTAPQGFDGWHGFQVLPHATPGHCVLEHRLEMRTSGAATWSWTLMIESMHDALIEDALASGQRALGLVPQVVPWPLRVRLLWALAARRARSRATRAQHAG